MKIIIGSDHAGYKLKTEIFDVLEKEYQILDIGCFTDERCDYPDIASEVCRQISEDVYGILICGTGIGISIAANRFEHVRCALCHDIESVIMARKHNDANCLALAGRKLDLKTALDIILNFIEIKFEGGRHQTRIAKLVQNPIRQVKKEQS